MLINDTNRKGFAKYLADYVSTEVERSMERKSEGFGAWDTGNMQAWLESGLEAYESINQTDIEKVLGFDICAELRRLAEKQRLDVAKHPKLERVLLPAIKASYWFCLDEHEQPQPDFEPIIISELLQFLADMIE